MSFKNPDRLKKKKKPVYKPKTQSQNTNEEVSVEAKKQKKSIKK